MMRCDIVILVRTVVMFILHWLFINIAQGYKGQHYITNTALNVVLTSKRCVN